MPVDTGGSSWSIKVWHHVWGLRVRTQTLVIQALGAVCPPVTRAVPPGTVGGPLVAQADQDDTVHNEEQRPGHQAHEDDIVQAAGAFGHVGLTLR